MRDNFKIYILYINEKIGAISESLYDIEKYVSQFKKFFQSSFNYYRLKEEIVNSNYYMCKYSDKILYWLNDDIVLTQKEIDFYNCHVFQPIYADALLIMSKIKSTMCQLKMTDDEYMAALRMLSIYQDKTTSYEAFLNSMNSQYLLDNYIIEPRLASMYYDEFNYGQL